MQLNGRDTLVFESFPQAVWNRVYDPEMQDCTMSIGSLRFCNFYRPVKLAKLRLPHAWDKPRGFRVSAYIENEGWRVLEELELPEHGQGDAHEFDLNGVETRSVKLECTSHYPHPQGTYAHWQSPYNVPYGILGGVSFTGDYLTDPYAPEVDELPVAKHLKRGPIEPLAPAGMTVKLGGNQVRYFGERFSVGFSLQRPIITQLGWDAIGAGVAGAGKAADNLIRHRFDIQHAHYPGQSVSLPGPHWRTLAWPAFSSLWGGDVSVVGDTVSYNVNVNDEVTVRAVFTVSENGMHLQLRQETKTGRPTIELAAWRFIFNAQVSAVASLAMPICSGRTGAGGLPLVWSAPGYGCLSCVAEQGSAPARVQVDSHRAAHTTTADIILGTSRPYATSSFAPGTTASEVNLDFRVEPHLPKLVPGIEPIDLHPAIVREWGSGLMFRPELGGFSNNALSINCNCSQAGTTDLAAFTARPARGPDPVELARHTITMAFKDGTTYGSSHNVYIDSDPAILVSAGRIHMAAPDARWLREVWPWVRRVALRHLAKCAPNGFVAAPISSGNRNTLPFSPSNGWDAISCGHFDGYTNADTYRAWKNVLGLAEEVGDDDMRSRMEDAAALLRENYEQVLWSEPSGWLGTWRSRDGELHDYGMLPQNASACLYGLVDEERARAIIANIEAQRIGLGLQDASFGFPVCVKPIPMYDQHPFIGGTAYRYDGRDAFGIYCNGSVTFGLAQHYLTALGRFGPPGAADRACQEILDAHIELGIVGGEGTGCEFHSHDGANCGYEGAYAPQFPILLAVAQHMGWTERGGPEFWPNSAAVVSAV